MRARVYIDRTWHDRQVEDPPPDVFVFSVFEGCELSALTGRVGPLFGRYAVPLLAVEHGVAVYGARQVAG